LAIVSNYICNDGQLPVDYEDAIENGENEEEDSNDESEGLEEEDNYSEAGIFRDELAKEMWRDYQAYLSKRRQS
jgi:hypothetical protein